MAQFFVYLFGVGGGDWPHHIPCGILVPQPGIEPVPRLQGKHGVLTIRQLGKSHKWHKFSMMERCACYPGIHVHASVVLGNV